MTTPNTLTRFRATIFTDPPEIGHAARYVVVTSTAYFSRLSALKAYARLRRRVGPRVPVEFEEWVPGFDWVLCQRDD